MSDRHPPRATRRIILVVLAVTLGVIGWVARTVVEATLSDGRVVDLGLLQLRLLHNPGVAFGLGAGLPTGVVAAGTGVIVLLIAAYAWRVAAEVPLPALLGLAAVLAGATTNLLDRLSDGTVTDYFHTGWFATFNLPDALISVGAVTVAATLILTPEREPDAP